jgi:hypothetical protein
MKFYFLREKSSSAVARIEITARDFLSSLANIKANFGTAAHILRSQMHLYISRNNALN